MALPMKFTATSLLVCAIALVGFPRFLNGADDEEGLEDLMLTPEVYSLHIRSDIAYRFATTHVTSRLANHAVGPREALFSMVIPKAAFITNFSMTIDGEVFAGEVKEKIIAKRQYETARKKGQSAGKVSSRARETNVFHVNINVAAQSKVDFHLTYQELLQRKFAFYEHAININPGHVVNNVSIEVNIRESRTITDVLVPPIKVNVTEVVDATKTNPDTSIERVGPGHVRVRYVPDEASQRRLSKDGISGQFLVRYDVERDLDAGEIQVIDGYFVHYFAPSGLQPVHKNVLFVLDRSGSMSGTKLGQTRGAMKTILKDMRPGDRFNVVYFSDYLRWWRDEEMMLASPDNIRDAEEFVVSMDATGGTNINDAMLRGLNFLSDKELSVSDLEPRPSMLIFLTDGEPTSGITALSKILNNVRKYNPGGRVSVFSLGFGRDVDFHFLQKLSLQNRGLARRIYADSDASLQLEDFYNEVSTPVMADIDIAYVGDVLEDEQVTDTGFPAYFRGSEIIVAGKLKNNVRTLSSRVTGHARDGFMSFDTDVRVARVEKDAQRTALSSFTERLWAYMTIRKALDKMIEASNSTVRDAAREKALELSLKYSFVTPLTSMVVVKPDKPDENMGDLEDGDKPGAEGDTMTRKRKGSSGPHTTLSSGVSGARGGGGGGQGVGGRGASPGNKHSFVDNDPHFIVQVDGLKDAICFDVNSAPGTVYQLLHDRVTGTVINGLVVGKPPPSPEAHPKTYIGEIVLIRGHTSIRVTPHKVVIDNSTVLQWRKSVVHACADSGIVVDVDAKKRIDIDMGDNTVFTILRHLVSPGHNFKVDFLGFYIQDWKGLSSFCHGLLGQFLHQRASLSYIQSPVTGNTSETQCELRMRGPHVSHRTVLAKRIQRRDMETKSHVTCWSVKNNGAGLLIGSHEGYIVPSLFYRKSPLARHRQDKAKNSFLSDSWQGKQSRDGDSTHVVP